MKTKEKGVAEDETVRERERERDEETQRRKGADTESDRQREEGGVSAHTALLCPLT